MQPREHIAKGERIEATARKLDRERDYEMLIEIFTNAGTHYMVAAMHVEGVTHEFFDSAHTFRPPPEFYARPPSPALQKAMDTFTVIENHRQAHIRENGKYDAELMDEVFKSFDAAKSAFLEIVGKSRDIPSWLDEPFWARR